MHFKQFKRNTKKEKVIFKTDKKTTEIIVIAHFVGQNW